VNADGRYAPSPTGPLHVGNLRTALLAWLFARSQGARFLLRIEDLDPQRSRREHEQGQLRDLRDLGLDWDDEPVRQSERRERHRQALAALEAQGRVYPCWCTRAEIREAAQAPHGPEVPYPGTCRARRNPPPGRPAALRLDARRERVSFKDRLHGPSEGVVDDFVLWRRDDVPAYNLAVVVDDADAGVGEVVRGADLLDSTPRQLLLARLLGFPPARHAHVPLVVGPDGRRLSKRERAPGGPPLRWMAESLGLAGDGQRVTPRDMLGRFDPDRVARVPAQWPPSET
jgi:glutamyl-tRNA synthetase